MPDAAARLHPFDAPGRQPARLAGGVAVVDAAFEQRRVGRDAGVRMVRHARSAGRLHLEVVEEDERFDELAEIARLISRVIGPCVWPAVR